VNQMMMVCVDFPSVLFVTSGINLNDKFKRN